MVSARATLLPAAPTEGTAEKTTVAARRATSGTSGVARTAAEAAAAAGLAAGPALLATFLLLGRPPLSPPTAAGLATFGPIAAALLLAFEGETRLLARLGRRGVAEARVWVLAGYSPLLAAWALVAALYHPAVHHWFVHVASVAPAMVVTLLAPALALKVVVLASLFREPVLALAWRYRYALAGAVYAAMAAAAKPSLWHIDLPSWFVPAAKLVLQGRALEIYGVRADVMGTPAPLEHGPLTVLFYAPFVALAEAAGAPDFLRLGAVYPLLGVVVVDCLMAYQVTRAVKDLAPRSSELHLFGLTVLVLFSPLLWFSSVWLVHLESLVALLVIGGLRLLSRLQARHAVAAGVLFGVALLFKHSAALAIGPLLLVALLTAGPRLPVLAGATMAAVTAIGLLPFALASPADFAFNYAGYDAIKPIYGLTIWKAIYDSGLEPLVMRLDSALVAILALACAGALGVRARVRGLVPRRNAGEPAAAALVATWWAAVVLAQIAWLGLATWQYPHYFTLGFVALLIWESAAQGTAATAGVEQADTAGGDRWPRWPVLSLLFLFVPYNLQAHLPNNVGKAGGSFVVARAAAQLCFLYACGLAVWLRATGSSRPPDSAPSPAPAADQDTLDR